MSNLLPHVAEYSNQHDNAVQVLMLAVGPLAGKKIIELLTLRHKSLLSELRYEKHNVLKMQGALHELESLIKDFNKFQ